MKPICITCKADCHNAGTTSRIVDCSQYKPGRVLTNADRIRAMTDEELAKKLTMLFWQVAQKTNAEHYILDWLQQPAEENT